MSRLLILFIFLLSVNYGRGQPARVTTDNIRAGVNFHKYGGIMIGQKLPPPDYDGTPYLNEDFRAATVVYPDNKSDKLEAVKIDLYNEVLIVRLDDQFHSIPWTEVSEVQMLSGTYVNFTGQPMGVLERLYEVENTGLYKKHYIWVKDATYVEGLNVGNRNMELIKKEAFYIRFNNQIFEIKNKKDLREAFSSDKVRHQYLNKYKYKVRSEEDLVQVLTAMNDVVAVN